MDIEKAFESIQNNLTVTRERDHCITQVCPCCGKYKFSADPSNVMGNCLDCGYTVMNNRSTIERFKRQGVFALSRDAKGDIFSIVEGGWEAAIETLPKAVVNAFDCTINELDYCILHSVKDDKVVTIDFKGML
jgi:hypothetical protein